MITQDAAEYLNQKYDDMSCLTAITGTTLITLNTQHTIIDVPEEFGHAVDKAQSESKKNGHLHHWDIYKTIWTQSVINQVSGEILNIPT